MFIEPTISWVPLGFSGYIWLDTKIVLKKKKLVIMYVKSLENAAGFGQRTLLLSLVLLSVVSAIGRAGLRKEVGLLRPGPHGPNGTR